LSSLTVSTVAARASRNAVTLSRDAVAPFRVFLAAVTAVSTADAPPAVSAVYVEMAVTTGLYYTENIQQLKR